MSEIENPPAFPFQANDGCGSFMEPSYGMSLRDYFAGCALMGTMTNVSGLGDVPPVIRADALRNLGGLLYEVADAMLLARKAPRS